MIDTVDCLPKPRGSDDPTHRHAAHPWRVYNACPNQTNRCLHAARSAQTNSATSRRPAIRQRQKAVKERGEEKKTLIASIATPPVTRLAGVAQETMLHLHIITLGKLKETFWQQAEAEYLKRLQPWTKITLHELKEESFSEKDNVEQIKQKEADKIFKITDTIKDNYIIALDEHGKQFSSVDFSKQIEAISQHNSNNLIFILGGPLGLDTSVIKQANLKLSLSNLTFTHQMARIFLLEQLYRSMTISNGKKYHY